MSSLPDHARKYQFDHNFFKRIDTEEKAYWLGFISADGTVFRTKENGRLLRLEVTRDDAKHLEKFKRAIKSEHHIYFRYHNDARTGKHYESAELKITSVELYNDLNGLGVKTSKQFDFVPSSLVHHFIRGLIDGDGSFGFNYKNRNPYLGFVDGDYGMVNAVLEILKAVCRSKANHILRASENSWFFHITGTFQIPKILDWIYHDAHVYLERKHSNYLKLQGLIANRSGSTPSILA
ncbi:MAG: hypothetical protein KGH57_03630 [Candidatus Micrarchaeota archaeon]|nr:hypothetical protein [Candidatus Micrarchaeota archaeon]